jgi:hypothetical protein
MGDREDERIRGIAKEEEEFDDYTEDNDDEDISDEEHRDEEDEDGTF